MQQYERELEPAVKAAETPPLPAMEGSRLWEVAPYLLLMVIAAVMRFWDLGSRALHHDESLHAVYSWYLFVGHGYQHNPMMHGPFQFHAAAWLYFLFGDSDFTARLLPALLGTLVVGLPYFLRSSLGRTGALMVAFLLTFSPSFLYFSRFMRNDIYVAFFTLGLVICLWRYLEEGKTRYLYLGAAALSLGFATKEVTFITVAIFTTFLFVVTARELFSVLWRRRSLSQLSRPASFLLLLGTLSLPLFAAVVTIPWNWLRPYLPPTLQPWGEANFFLAAGFVLLLLLTGVSIGRRWQARPWLISATIFYGIYVVLFSTFFTHLPGIGTGIWGSLDYWLEQHGVQRGGQPWYYYFILIPVHEFLPLAFVLPAMVYGFWRGKLFAVFLIYWTMMAFILYSWAGEKMPWLILHLALPLILLAGHFLGQLIEGTDWKALARQGGFYLMPLLLLIVFAGRSLRPIPPGPLLAFFYTGLAALALVALLGGALYLGWRLGWRRTLQVVAATAFAVLFLFSVRAAWQASYKHGDIPVEMLVYTQTSPDIPKLMKEIDRLAFETGKGKDLPITVDSTDGFSWPWAWYLRNYKKVDYPSLHSMGTEPAGSVLLLNVTNERVAQPYLDKYGPGLRFRHRWWFPEDYRGETGERFVSELTSFENWSRWWDYFVYRKIKNPLGSVDAMAYFPKDFVWSDSLLARTIEVSLPEGPQVGSQGELIIGGKGTRPGNFDSPRGVVVDSQGNIYVADSGNHRIQKFDSQGRFLASVGRRGVGPGEFNEPWGVAVDAEGNVYVADTWNHRLQKFNVRLEFVKEWGGFADAREAVGTGQGKLFGPRQLVVDVQGNLYVMDTGNKRVQKFDAEGHFLALYGGPGSGPGLFSEPVGLARDTEGNFYVADTWNRRIQKFDADFQFRSEFSVSGWEGEHVLNKPYLAVDAQGHLLATDPLKHRVLRFSPRGELLSTLGSQGTKPGSLDQPTGIALDAQGRVYLAEAGNHRVQRLPSLS